MSSVNDDKPSQDGGQQPPSDPIGAPTGRPIGSGGKDEPPIGAEGSNGPPKNESFQNKGPKEESEENAVPSMLDDPHCNSDREDDLEDETNDLGGHQDDEDKVRVQFDSDVEDDGESYDEQAEDDYAEHIEVPGKAPKKKWLPKVMQGQQKRSPSTELQPSWSQEDHLKAPRVRVEFFTNEKSFKERLHLYFVKNQRSSLRIRMFNLAIKLLSCALYIFRVSLDDPKGFDCYPLPFSNRGLCWNESRLIHYADADEFLENPVINWELIWWVNRAEWLWIVQVTVAAISLAETLLLTYLGYKGNILTQIATASFLLEIVNTVPFLITIFYKPLRNLYVPVFLNCWLAKNALENMMNDLHRALQRSQSALSQQLVVVVATLLCLVFTSICGIQHFQRGGYNHYNLFDSLWFVIVTFSTVGYGDISPDIWPSKLFMMITIIATLITLPSKLEQLALTWLERQNQGGTYSSHRAQNEKHVVACATTLKADTVMDFLNEFYAHPKLQDFFVVLLSPCELDATMKMILQVPLWAARVIFIRGSALKDRDLGRCRMQDAEACFILAARSYKDRAAADQHTILRSWAVKDFAPHCPQYVQIFRPENKFHVKFAEHVVCEDEFKYALLANNCLCPGASTLVTLLLHTSRGLEGQESSEDWIKMYGKCSGNEIYHIRLGDSRFFSDYDGKSFTYASFHAHRKYGVALVGIKQETHHSTIQLNPGPRHIMKKTDICFYMNITKEENSAFILAHPNQDKETGSIKHKSVDNSKVVRQISNVDENKESTVSVPKTRSAKNLHPTLQNQTSNSLEIPKASSGSSFNRRPSIAPVPAVLEGNEIEITVDSEPESDVFVGPHESDAPLVMEYVKGFPPISPYIGSSPRLCHLMRTKQFFCCLQLAKTCEHCQYKNAKEYNWSNRAIIIAADHASNGLYNFIVPLRSHARPRNSLNPIILLLERKPTLSFLETICYFPMVYWMIGSIDNLSDLLRAGINLADNVVIVNKESSNAEVEETLSDCNTIVAVQTIFRLFPSARIVTELSQANNMRFMQFRAKDRYALSLSKLEKKEKDRGSHLYYMFRLPFAAGSVFSASMLDTLLYQAFVKDYLITFVRLLLGIDQAVGSGHLSSMKISEDELWIGTYGRLYQKLCGTTCEIPIGVYRTQKNQFTSGNASQSFMERNLSFKRLSFRGKKPSSLHLNSNEPVVNTTAAERREISQLVTCRMKSMGLPVDDYNESSDNRSSISYVIINPSYDLKLEMDDVIYTIKQSPRNQREWRRSLRAKQGAAAGKFYFSVNDEDDD